MDASCAGGLSALLGAKEVQAGVQNCRMAVIARGVQLRVDADAGEHSWGLIAGDCGRVAEQVLLWGQGGRCSGSLLGT